MIEIKIELNTHPDRQGTLTVLNADRQAVLGPFPVAGFAQASSDQGEASPAAEHAPKCGISPGRYSVKQVLPMVGAPLSDIRELGRYGLIVLERTEEADSSSSLVYLHGGSLATDGVIRPTADSLRLKNRHIHDLVSFLSYTKEVTVSLTRILSDSESGHVAMSQASALGTYLKKVASALPLALTAFPGLFPVGATAQTGSSCYDSGTNFSDVDYDYIQQLFGENAIDGYVPNSLSGVTIAGGLDLGIYTSSQLESMGFSASEVSGWAHYVAPNANSHLIGSAASAVLTKYPLTITPASAVTITDTYYKWAANTIGSLYNTAVASIGKIKGTKFSSLPLHYQTAMTAMYITNTSFQTSAAFNHFASGLWTNGITALRSYGSNNASVNKLATQYADYLAKSPLP